MLFPVFTIKCSTKKDSDSQTGPNTNWHTDCMLYPLPSYTEKIYVVYSMCAACTTDNLLYRAVVQNVLAAAYTKTSG